MIKRTSMIGPRLNLSAVPGVNREADFRRQVYVYKIIANIPWTVDESEAFDADAELMKRTVEESLNRRQETVNSVPYDAPQWVLDEVKFKFEDLPVDLYHKARKFVLYEIITHDWRELTTIKSHLYSITRFFKLYRKEHPNALASYIHAEDIISFIDGTIIAPTSKHNILSVLCRFYTFWGLNYVRERQPVEVSVLKNYITQLHREEQAYREKGQYPTIPDKVFYQMHFRMMELIRNPRTPFDEAVTACMVELYMWTGLRPKEIRCLRRGCLIMQHEDGKEMPFYEYLSHKNGNRAQTIFLFPSAEEALKRLEALQTRRENVFITDYLISFWDHQENTPMSYDKLFRAYGNLLCKYMPEELAKPHPDLSKFVGCGYVTIYRPSFYTFRVHLCTYLVDHGLDERWVEAHLGHLSEAIRGTYYRMKEWRRIETKRQVAELLPEASVLIGELTQELTERKPKVNEEKKGWALGDRLIELMNKPK